MIKKFFLIAWLLIFLIIIRKMEPFGWNKVIKMITLFSVCSILLLALLKSWEIYKDIQKEKDVIAIRIRRKLCKIQSLQHDVACYFKNEKQLCMRIFPDCFIFVREPKGKEIYENIFFDAAFSPLNGFLYIKLAFQEYLKLHVFL